MQTAGIILCGGKSSRMGTSKAMLPVGEELMLQRVARLLGEAVEPLVVVAAEGQDLPALPPAILLARDTHSDSGPLQGLRDGLAALPNDMTAAYVTGCDVPFLMPGFVRRMADMLGEYQIAVPVEGEFAHPLAAVYSKQALPDIDALLSAGERKMQVLLKRCQTRSVPGEELRGVDPELASLLNCNSPADYAAAKRKLGSSA